MALLPGDGANLLLKHPINKSRALGRLLLRVREQTTLFYAIYIAIESFNTNLNTVTLARYDKGVLSIIFGEPWSFFISIKEYAQTRDKAVCRGDFTNLDGTQTQSDCSRICDHTSQIIVAGGNRHAAQCKAVR